MRAIFSFLTHSQQSTVNSQQSRTVLPESISEVFPQKSKIFSGEVMMSQLKTKLLTDTWVTATWDEYIENIKQPEYDRAKSYYYNGQLRIEMAAVGPDHADDNGIIVILINLFSIAKGIKMRRSEER